MNGSASLALDYSEFVEIDPTGRYGRYNEILGKGASKTVYKAFDEYDGIEVAWNQYNEILGKGASKTVYKAFDEYDGIEVAWNQVKLCDFLQSPEDLERLYREIHLLKTLNHENIMKFYTSWVDIDNRNINFVTEMFTSGTLRQYRLKHRRVNIRAVKHWCRQILKGLHYLHSHDPPIIHRDLKCDNIFVNGNQGEVKIGDLGLAAILKKSHAVRCVGTPEFMAPEVYEEEYNELVDIYSFGMCVLEMVTFDYPYSECTHPAQIYKKVITGKRPDALYKVNDPEVREFVEKCLATVSTRLSARELLMDPFLQIDDYGYDLSELKEVGWEVSRPLYEMHHSDNSFINGYTNYPGYDSVSRLEHLPVEFETTEIDLFICQEDEHLDNFDIAIKGRRREDDGIFLRLRIADKEGRIRNIYFPFDIETDTALSVATEMIAELDITDQDVLKIADMIDGEIATLVPEWKKGVGVEDSHDGLHSSLCHSCAARGNLMDYVSSNNPPTKKLQVLECSNHGCAAVRGRFEEITYQVEGPEQCTDGDGTPVESNKCQSNGIKYTDIWAQRDGPEACSPRSKDILCDEVHGVMEQLVFENDEKIITMDSLSEVNTKSSVSDSPAASDHWDTYENQIRREMRWLKAKYQIQLRELKDKQMGVNPKSPSPNSDNIRLDKENEVRLPLGLPKAKREHNPLVLKSQSSGKLCSLHFTRDVGSRCANAANSNDSNCEGANSDYSKEQMLTAKSYYTGALLPQSLHRATSLPVDAVDV
ncbi:hypothetical protein Tsubulata_033530 [Turnera subulata]|uniref:non-specific serine/threonine protein kinase n=1 Tax=Turnera subulata TaxID=218843 RepID=A0A9Q0F6A0_9ROSI|nr:hypothetical protein Tsubulata_033530 [Turnera subulata]